MAESTLFVFRSVLRICSYFNPRTPVGCDDFGVWRPNIVIISIHAPQWGATGRQHSRPTPQDFNPRTPVGCDDRHFRRHQRIAAFQSTHPSGVRLSLSMSAWLSWIFQSTHPSGVRRTPTSIPTGCRRYFNPRTPVGCDGRLSHSLNSPSIKFQSTHPSGVRRYDTALRLCPTDFNPRTPVGCDRSRHRVDASAVRFQSTHPSGVRRFRRTLWPCRRYFNPRTPVGCDSRKPSTTFSRRYFNPRTPVGCDC